MELIRLRTKIFTPNFDLFSGIIEALSKNKQQLSEKDILIVNSKIVAVSQDRVVNLDSLPLPTKKTAKKSHYGMGTEEPCFVALVQKEADIVVPGHMLLTVKNGIFTPAAGIDRSNTPEGSVVLWPKDPWKVSFELCKKLRSHFKLKNVGVVIVDSTCQPLRAGTSGVALAWAGFKGVEDVRGKKDLYGKKLTVTRKALADNLACAAQILMGEANEKSPLVIARKVPAQFTATKPSKTAGSVSLKDCLYSGLYKNVQ